MESTPVESTPLYRQLAEHYRRAIASQALRAGDRMPSVRALMAAHGVSLSTALQACRQLEREGWLEARPRSGYFVRAAERAHLWEMGEPQIGALISQEAEPARYVGIHERISTILARSRDERVLCHLGGASAAPILYPVNALRRAARRLLQQDPMLYAEPVRPQGDKTLRSALARLALSAHARLSPDETIITHGCTEALQLALRAVTRPGEIVAVESPTYYGLLQILESLGLRALEIPCNAQTGLSLEALELALRNEGEIKAVVTVPNVQNPLGSIMPDTTKAQLVAWCETNGIPLIEDDCFSATFDGDKPLRAAKSWDSSGNVIYCSSLHKVLAPGMRLGWIAAGKWHARVEMLKFALSRPNEMLAQLAVADLIESGEYERHLRRLRIALRQQREWMANKIASSFPIGTRLSLPRGGTFLWVGLPEGVSSEAVFDAALEQGVFVAPGVMFSNSNRFDRFIRISTGFPASERLSGAVETVGALARRFAR